jgi:hypothetical protein
MELKYWPRNAAIPGVVALPPVAGASAVGLAA